MLTRDALLERLRGLKLEDIEVKEAQWAVPDSSYETVSTVANTSCGWLIFGVAETPDGFKVAGVTDPDKMQGDFLSSCWGTEKFSRPVEVRPKLYDIDGMTVMGFYVPPSRRFDKPIRVRSKKAWFTYIRIAGGV